MPLNSFDLDEPSLVSAFDELPLWSAPFGLKLLEAVRYRPGLAALDIGPGTGFPALELAMRLGARCRYIAVDPWAEGLRRAEMKRRVYGAERCVFARGRAERLPLADASVDLIVSNNGINNVSDLPRTLRECARVARSDAQFVFTMNTGGSMRAFYDALRDALQRRGLADAIDGVQRHIHYKRRPLGEMTALAEEAGFAVDAVRQHAFDYRFADADALFRHFFIRLAFLPSWRELVPAECVEAVFDDVRSALQERAAADGRLMLDIPFALFDCRRRAGDREAADTKLPRASGNSK
jgi:arsenite methyltransferase